MAASKRIKARRHSYGQRLGLGIVIASVCALSGVVAIANATGGTNQAPDPLAASKAHILAAEASAIEKLPARSKNEDEGRRLAESMNPDPMPSPLTGIIHIRYGPFSSAEFRVSAVYQDYVLGSWYAVYAGTDSDGKSAVKVRRGDSYESVSDIGVFRAVGCDGQLEITSYADGILELRDENGSSILFDLKSLGFK